MDGRYEGGDHRRLTTPVLNTEMRSVGQWEKNFGLYIHVPWFQGRSVGPSVSNPIRFETSVLDRSRKRAFIRIT